GLHQAPRAWYGTLSKYLLTNGFQRGTIDQTLVIRRQRGDFILVQVYMDDIIFGSSNPQLCKEIEALMHEKFQMSAMDARSTNTPMDKENPWGKDRTGKDVDLHHYRSMIGSLMYLIASRLDIMFAVCACASNTIMARLQFCDYHNMVAILKKSEHNINFHPMVDFIEASLLRYALTVKPTVYVSHILQFWSTARIETTKEGTQILAIVDGIYIIVTESSLKRNLKLKYEEGISSLPDTELFENLTLMGYNISPNQKTVSLFDTMLVQQGEGSGTPTEPHHTPSLKAQSPSHTTHTLPTLPPATTTSIPTVTPSDTPIVRQYTRRTRIAQSSVLPTIADEPTSPLRNVSQGEACPTDSGFIADQDRATIDKSSTLPHDSAPRVTSPTAVEGNMQQTIPELTALCTSLQRQLSELTTKFQAQEGRSMDKGEATTERISDDSKEMATVLSSMDAATVLASEVVDVPTSSGSIPTASTPAEEQVPTGSDVVPTASPSSALPPIADEPASPLRNVSEAPRITSPAFDEGSMQLKLDELTGLCTSLQRQHSEMVAKFNAQELEINRYDAPIKGRNLDEGEAASERVSDDTEEMATILTSMDATTVLASGVAEVPTSSGSIHTAGPPAAEVPTGSDVVPTAGLIFTTATVVTSYTRRKGKETVVESEAPKKKKIQEKMDI
nr:hypothetical protein [Tanacetum cinerariifolium]